MADVTTGNGTEKKKRNRGPRPLVQRLFSMRERLSYFAELVTGTECADMGIPASLGKAIEEARKAVAKALDAEVKK